MTNRVRQHGSRVDHGVLVSTSWHCRYMVDNAFLLARGADPLRRYPDGRTPLSDAEYRGYWLAVEIIRDRIGGISMLVQHDLW